MNVNNNERRSDTRGGAREPELTETERRSWRPVGGRDLAQSRGWRWTAGGRRWNIILEDS